MRPASLFTPAFAAFAVAAAALPATARAQTLSVPAQVSPLRIDFTRPGGLPGASRVGVAPSGGLYMIAPAQPKTSAAPKKKKRKRR
jgi:hypothetical protein